MTDWTPAPSNYIATPGDLVRVVSATSGREWIGFVTRVSARAPKVLDVETAEHRYFPRGWVAEFVPRDDMELRYVCSICLADLVTEHEQHYCRKADTTDGPIHEEESDES